MYEPILFYGINLGRISEKKRNLPEEVMPGDGIFDEIDAVAFEELAKRNGLEAFFGGEDSFGGETYDFSQVHVGIMIRSEYGEELGECTSFSLRHLDSLKENPSELVEKLKKIGLDARANQLCLYGYTAID